MSRLKEYVSSYLTEEEADNKTVATILSYEWNEGGAYGIQLDLTVDFAGAQRKITINKGNARRLIEGLGDKEEGWIGGKFRIREPLTNEEKKTGTKLITVPVIQPVEEIVGLKQEGDRKLTQEEIKVLEKAGLR